MKPRTHFPFLLPGCLRWAMMPMLCLLTNVGAARGALTWEKREVNLGVQDVSKEPGTLEARFPFQNKGSTAVEIRSLQPGCSCTVAELSKRRYEPGERGEILLRFEVGERTGPQDKILTVETSGDDPNVGPVQLHLRADLPEAARLRPAFVFWTQGEAVSVKTLSVEAPGGSLGEVRVESSTPDVSVEPRVLESGRRWELLVRPAGGTGRTVIATLRVICRFTPPGGAAPFERTFKAYAAVKPPVPGATTRP